MSAPTPEFDSFSGSYQNLLKDPIRDRFTSAGGDFFNVRKRELILDYFRRMQVDTQKLNYLDLGCGQGELMMSMRGDFATVAGCDPSSGMIQSGGIDAQNVVTRVQTDPGKIPFDSGQFDFVTAVCVYHHVPPAFRAGLTAEVARVMKPGGIFAIIEHNPLNPITQMIVKRAPIDVDAILLGSGETRDLLKQQNLSISDQRYFLYFPEQIYRSAKSIERLLDKVPLGGQYAVFGKLETGSVAHR